MNPQTTGANFKIARASSGELNQFDTIDLDDIFEDDYMYPEDNYRPAGGYSGGDMSSSSMYGQNPSQYFPYNNNNMNNPADYNQQQMQQYNQQFYGGQPMQGNDQGAYYYPPMGMQGISPSDQQIYQQQQQQQQMMQQQQQPVQLSSNLSKAPGIPALLVGNPRLTKGRNANNSGYINNNNNNNNNNYIENDVNIQPGSVIMIPPVPPTGDSQMGMKSTKSYRKDKKTGLNLVVPDKKPTKAQQKKLDKQLLNQTSASSSSSAKKIKKDHDDNGDGDGSSDDEREDDVGDGTRAAHKRSKSSSSGGVGAGDGGGDHGDDNDSFGGEIEGESRLERRERNREHAKRSRVRKRLLLGTLQDRLSILRQENVKLRRLVMDRLPTMAAMIFNNCTTQESDLLNRDDEVNLVHGNTSDADSFLGKDKRSSSSSSSSGGGHGEVTMSSSTAAMYNTVNNPIFTVGGSADGMTVPQSVRETRILMEPDFRLIQALQKSQHNFVLSDPSLPDNPIVYCSDGFCKLTGYKRQHILGRNCRFLQGPGTDQNAVDIIRQGVAVGADISVCLLNYKADGTPFWNQFFVAALRDSDGCIVNFVGVQCEVNSIPIASLKDRVKKIKIPDDK